MNMVKCFKCGTVDNLVKHHTSYDPEIIVDCCLSCHVTIHKNLPKIDDEQRRISVYSAVRRRYWRQKPILEIENKKPLIIDDELKGKINSLLEVKECWIKPQPQ